MDDERIYRVLLGVLLLAATVVLVPFRVRAARGGEKISHRDEGFVFAATLRLTGLAFWSAVLAFLIQPRWIAVAAFPLPAAVRYSGALWLLIGGAIVHRALTHLGRNLTDTVVVRRNATLVTSGPYRFVRHPFYCGTALLLVGVVSLTANGIVAATVAAILVMLAVRTPREEARLVERFGDDYRRYRATTGRFFPRIPA